MRHKKNKLRHKLIKQRQLMKKRFLSLLLLFTIFSAAWAGTIKGVVSDQKTKELLVGVTIIVSDAADVTNQMITGTSTDLDGNYSITLDPGNYKLTFSYVAYDPQEFEFEVGSEEITHNVLLLESGIELESVEVTAKVSRESENILLMDQKKATGIEEKIGAKELSKKGASDVAAGVKKIAGVSMMGSKQLFVRGLGDRYNSTQLNGLPLVSPDPTKKIIKLDLFQSDVVQYLNVQKAYTVRNFADYTGALIDINTLDYPEYEYLKFDLGSKYNTNSTGNEFKQINADGFRFMGFDVKKRQNLTPQEYWIAKKRTQVINPDFNFASYGFSQKNAAPAMNIGVSGGKLIHLNAKRKLGVLFNASFKNEFAYHPDVIQKQVNKQNILDGDFVSQKYSYNSYVTTLFSLSYLHNSNHSIKYNFVYLNNGEDGYTDKIGTRPDWQSGEKTAIIRNAQYVNYRLLNHQLSGKHSLSNKIDLNWAAGLSNVNYNVPDRREVVYINQTADDDNTWVYMTLNNGNDTKRVIVEQNTNEIDLSINAKYKLGADGEKGEIAIGGQSKQTKLEYRSYYYGYVFETQAGNETLPVDINNPDDYFGDDYLKKVKNNSSDNMGYDGRLQIFAGFADAVYNVNEKLTLNAGLRVESSTMGVTPDLGVNDGDEEESAYSNLDFFPALNIKYALNEKMNLRLSGSRTVTRPSFYEKSPAFIIPEQGERQTIGNPYTKENLSTDSSYLENSYSNNIEIKWEYFSGLGELISLGAYGKMIDEPIERVSKLKGGTDITYTFQNFPEKGYAAGLEFVFRKKFGPLFTGLNAALIYTHVTIPDNYNELNKERQLQGASPYLINADLGYEFKYGANQSKTTYASLVYNVYGKRIYTVGISGAGNQYQMPFHTLDLILKNKLNEKLSIDITVQNILNYKYTIKQDIFENADNPDEITGDQVIYEYQQGINFGISLKYKI